MRNHTIITEGKTKVIYIWLLYFSRSHCWATLHDLSLILNHYMLVKLLSDWFYQIWANSSIEDNVKAVGLQVNVSSPITNLFFKACENIQWCKKTCYMEVGFKAGKNINFSKNTNYWITKKKTNKQTNLTTE